MQHIKQIFCKSINKWNEKQKQQVEKFFLLNSFFSKFYQNKKLSQIAKLTFYRNLLPGEKLLLEKNNRVEAIILLSGHVIIRKKQRLSRRMSKISDQQNEHQSLKKQRTTNIKPDVEFVLSGHLKQFNQTLTLNSECIVQVPEDNQAQILFVPCALYYKLLDEIENQRVNKIEKVLENFFFRLNKRELHELSQSNCIFRQFKKSNYIYRVNSKPEQIFVLLEGTVKLQKPGFSEQTLKENIFVNAGMIFGQKDIKLVQRLRNAIACTSHVELLTVPKNSFLKFAKKAFPELIFDQTSYRSNKLPRLDEKSTTSRSKKAQLNQKDSFLPSIANQSRLHQHTIGRQSRFHQNSITVQHRKSENREKREYELIKTSHMLLDFRQRSKGKLILRNFSPNLNKEIRF